MELNLGETAVVNFGPNPESDAESSLHPILQAAICLVNGELELSARERRITLFIVTPTATNPVATGAQ